MRSCSAPLAPYSPGAQDGRAQDGRTQHTPFCEPTAPAAQQGRSRALRPEQPAQHKQPAGHPTPGVKSRRTRTKLTKVAPRKRLLEGNRCRPAASVCQQSAAPRAESRAPSERCGQRSAAPAGPVPSSGTGGRGRKGPRGLSACFTSWGLSGCTAVPPPSARRRPPAPPLWSGDLLSPSNAPTNRQPQKGAALRPLWGPVHKPSRARCAAELVVWLLPKFRENTECFHECKSHGCGCAFLLPLAKPEYIYVTYFSFFFLNFI